MLLLCFWCFAFGRVTINKYYPSTANSYKHAEIYWNIHNLSVAGNDAYYSVDNTIYYSPRNEMTSWLKVVDISSNINVFHISDRSNTPQAYVLLDNGIVKYFHLNENHVISDMKSFRISDYSTLKDEDTVNMSTYNGGIYLYLKSGYIVKLKLQNDSLTVDSINSISASLILMMSDADGDQLYMTSGNRLGKVVCDDTTHLCSIDFTFFADKDIISIQDSAYEGGEFFIRALNVNGGSSLYECDKEGSCALFKNSKIQNYGVDIASSTINFPTSFDGAIYDHYI